MDEKISFIFFDQPLYPNPSTSLYGGRKLRVEGLNPSSNTCNRYIDTNRLYKNKYIFTSKPIDRASRDQIIVDNNLFFNIYNLNDYA